MKSLNRVMLLGNLAADVDFRQTSNGFHIATFPLATNRVYKKSDGETMSTADFHRIVAWNKLGEICQKYLAKGTAVLIEGRIINNTFEDKEGNRHYKTEIVATDVNILTWKKSKQGKKEVGIESIDKDKEDDVVQQLEKEAVSV